MNIIEGLQSEMNRVRRIMKEYEGISAVAFALDMMKTSIKNAEKSIAIGDTIGMIRAYKDLKEYTL